jgi:hypothetical protein
LLLLLQIRTQPRLGCCLAAATAHNASLVAVTSCSSSRPLISKFFAMRFLSLLCCCAMRTLVLNAHRIAYSPRIGLNWCMSVPPPLILLHAPNTSIVSARYPSFFERAVAMGRTNSCHALARCLHAVRVVYIHSTRNSQTPSLPHLLLCSCRPQSVVPRNELNSFQISNGKLPSMPFQCKMTRER